MKVTVTLEAPEIKIVADDEWVEFELYDENGHWEGNIEAQRDYCTWEEEIEYFQAGDIVKDQDDNVYALFDKHYTMLRWCGKPVRYSGENSYVLLPDGRQNFNSKNGYERVNL